MAILEINALPSSAAFFPGTLPGSRWLRQHGAYARPSRSPLSQTHNKNKGQYRNDQGRPMGICQRGLNHVINSFVMVRRFFNSHTKQLTKLGCANYDRTSRGKPDNNRVRKEINQNTQPEYTKCHLKHAHHHGQNGGIDKKTFTA